jgi:hypothetical protein
VPLALGSQKDFNQRKISRRNLFLRFEGWKEERNEEIPGEPPSAVGAPSLWRTPLPSKVIGGYLKNLRAMINIAAQQITF